MTEPVHFPLELPFQSVVASEQSGAIPYQVCAMLTESYMQHGERLAASCRKFGLPFAIYVVPTVHNSISHRGTPDPRFTKANFIHFLLETYQMPIVYLDADCYFEEYPALFDQLVREKCDFAIYNWLADKDNCAYRPVPLSLNIDGREQLVTNRYYVFSHSINFISPHQLLCSGAVQFYGNTGAARMLLRNWHEIVAMFPGSADDPCLDFTFNRRLRGTIDLKVKWLPKSYVRYPWWIQARPVINHPDHPSPGTQFITIEDRTRVCRFWLEEAQPHAARTILPSRALLDIETGDVYSRDEVTRTLHLIGRVEQQLWR